MVVMYSVGCVTADSAEAVTIHIFFLHSFYLFRSDIPRVVNWPYMTCLLALCVVGVVGVHWPILPTQLACTVAGWSSGVLVY